ncbi:zinc finger domain-containing protein [Streptomyces venezuelae]
MRPAECPTCKTAAGRRCHTAGDRPTNEHPARRDAVGPIPYAKGRNESLIPEQRTHTIPAVLKESEKARADPTRTPPRRRSRGRPNVPRRPTWVPCRVMPRARRNLPQRGVGEVTPEALSGQPRSCAVGTRLERKS